MASKIKVGVNGFGTIGKRVADAIRLQPDMELVGVTANSNNYRVQSAHLLKKIPIFNARLRRKNPDFEELQRTETQAAIDDLKSILDLPIEKRKLATEKIVSRMNLLTSHLSAGDFDEDARDFKSNAIDLAGGLDDLLEACDVMVDCTPKPFGRINKPVYQEFDVKSIYQGGESADVAEVSFVAQANYDQSLNKKHVRVVSCNTTGLVRVLHGLHQRARVKLATVTLIRRGTDSNEHKKGPINAIIPSLEAPSHHGPDVRTVIPEIEVFSSAYVVPTTLMHVHDLQIDMIDQVEVSEVLEILHNTPRVRVLPASMKMGSTAQILDFARDLAQNSRGDMMDICVWERTVGTYTKFGHNKLFIKMAVHQESDVIPENIDAIRAVTGFADGSESMRITDESLNMQINSDYYGFVPSGKRGWSLA